MRASVCACVYVCVCVSLSLFLSLSLSLSLSHVYDNSFSLSRSSNLKKMTLSKVRLGRCESLEIDLLLLLVLSKCIEEGEISLN